MTWDGESEQRFLSRIAAESARLGRLVDDLLDFSAIESATLRLAPDWCDLALVLDAARACLPPAGAAAVEVECAAGLPVVWADHDRLEQVFVNLLENALRHNPEGTRVRVEARPRGRPTVIVRVTDDGAGPRGRDRGRARAASRGSGAGRRPAPASGSRSRAASSRRTAGAIALERGGGGTRFRISLPIDHPDAAAGAGPTSDRLIDV